MPNPEEVIANDPVDLVGPDAPAISSNPWSSVAASVYSDLTGRDIQQDAEQLISGRLNGTGNGIDIASKRASGAVEMILSNFSLKDDKRQTEITKSPDLMEKLPQLEVALKTGTVTIRRDGVNKRFVIDGKDSEKKVEGLTNDSRTRKPDRSQELPRVPPTPEQIKAWQGLDQWDGAPPNLRQKTPTSNPRK